MAIIVHAGHLGRDPNVSKKSPCGLGYGVINGRPQGPDFVFLTLHRCNVKNRGCGGHRLSLLGNSVTLSAEQKQEGIPG